MSVPSYLILRGSSPALGFSVLMSKVCFVCGGVTIVENDFDLIATADASLGDKGQILSLFVLLETLSLFVLLETLSLFVLLETLSLFVLLDLLGSAGLVVRRDLQEVAEIFIWTFNLYFFRVLSTEDFVRRIKRRIEGERAKQYDESMRMLIPQIGEKAWGEKRVGNKVDMIGEMVKFKPRINTGNDNACMKKYLYRVSRDGLDQPSMLRRDQFLPVDAPLLDYLVESSKNVVGWKYPRLEDLEYYQANRGLSLEMLKQVEVKELVCGRSTKEEILEVARWVERMHALDQEKFGTQVISLDVEDVKVTFYDNLRMAGKIQIPGGQAPLRTAVEKDMIYGYMKDTWKPIPGKIMFGNGITWTCLISLDLERDERFRYIVRRMKVQPEILDLLRDLPVAAGLAVRRDLQGIEEFYSLISGEEVSLERGCLDLTTLAILAGYKFHSKNMTAMGVQVMGTLLNKTVSTGDNLWGLRWSRIPDALKCYALGDIKFGFVTYNVLAGLLLRDVFPDPDVVCRFLECNQVTAVNWFLEFVLQTLEGVSYHQTTEDLALTREEMIRSLRFRDDRGRLCDASPPFVRLWLELLGSWPSVTFGGCRYMIQCREWFLTQIQVLIRAQIKWSDGRVLRDLRDDDREYSRFGLSLGEIGDQTWRGAVSETWRMVRPEGVSVPLLEFDISSTKPCEIGRRCTEIGRCQRWSLLEWARMNPDRLRGFFARMIRDPWFQTHYANMYDAMRLCYRRICDENAPRVKKVEVQLCNAVKKSLEVEMTGLERARTVVGVRELRVKYLTELGKDWTFKERTRWTVEVPVLPGWKPRGGRKRARSVTRSKVGAEKVRSTNLRSLARVGPVGVAASVQSASQPDPGVPGARIGFVDQDDGLHQEEEMEDVVLLNEDDLEDEAGGSALSSGLPVESMELEVQGPAPKKKRLSSAPKVSRNVRVRTYDELIEGSDNLAYDDLDFEFEVPKEVEEIEV